MRTRGTATMPLLGQHCISAAPRNELLKKIRFENRGLEAWRKTNPNLPRCTTTKSPICHLREFFALHKLFVYFSYITTMWCWSNILIGCLNCLFTPHKINILHWFYTFVCLLLLWDAGITFASKPGPGLRFTGQNRSYSFDQCLPKVASRVCHAHH